MIVFCRTSTRTVCVGGFAKSDQDNVDDDDLRLFRELAVEYLPYAPAEVMALLKAGEWIEVECDG